MAFKIPRIDFGALHRYRRRHERDHKFIFTKKQWILFAVAAVLCMAASGGLTAGILLGQQKSREAASAKEEALFMADDDSFGFASQKLEIPAIMKAERKPEPAYYRALRKNWSEEQILGTPGHSEWTDPSEISTEMIEVKNDLLMKEFFDEVR